MATLATSIAPIRGQLCNSDKEILPWYALHVRPRHEKHVSFLLEEKGFTTFLPLYVTRRRWADRMKVVELPLFPHYLFCRLDENRKTPIVATPGVLSIVGLGRRPVPVDASEIDAVQRVVRSHHAREPFDFVRPGVPVRVETGALAGLTGTLVEIKRVQRLVISVSLLQRSILVEIDRESVSPLETEKMVVG